MKKPVLSILVILILALATYSILAPQAGQTEEDWPPRVGKKYPDITLRNTQGDEVSLAKFRGKVLLIEPIGMSCPACQAFSGAAKLGGFAGVKPQAGLQSIADYFPQYTRGLSLTNSEIVFIQILFYNMSMKAPTLDDAQKWAKHFKLDSQANHHVLFADSSFINKGTYNLIPGFQLVDKSFVLRYDSTGHRPKHNLFSELLPAVPRLIKQ